MSARIVDAGAEIDALRDALADARLARHRAELDRDAWRVLAWAMLAITLCCVVGLLVARA